jgi:hypothetical protein
MEVNKLAGLKGSCSETILISQTEVLTYGIKLIVFILNKIMSQKN